jgi:hypothetical protein
VKFTITRGFDARELWTTEIEASTLDEAKKLAEHGKLTGWVQTDVLRFDNLETIEVQDETDAEVAFWEDGEGWVK